jgi:hypothetical protein
MIPSSMIHVPSSCEYHLFCDYAPHGDHSTLKWILFFHQLAFDDSGLLWRVVSSPPHDQLSTLSSGSCINYFSNDDAPLLSFVNVLLSIIGMAISIMFFVGLLATEAGD